VFSLQIERSKVIKKQKQQQGSKKNQVKMDAQAELANAVKQRYNKVYGIEPSPKTPAKQTKRTSRRREPAMSNANKASRSEAKKAAAAAIMARMGGRPPPSSSPSATATATDKKKKQSFQMPLSSRKGASVANSAMATGGGPLNKTEDETAQKYRKMVKMGLPEGAVRHKMISDGVSGRVVEAVMSGEDSTPRSQSPALQKRPVDDGSGQRSSLSVGEENIAQKYRKMMKIGMPEGAVLHKMIADGISVKIQDAVMAGESSSPVYTRTAARSSAARKKENGGTSTRSSGSSLSLEEEKIAAQYRTMIKIKMPEGAVRHKMMADGVATKIQDSVFRGDIPRTSSSSSSSTTSSSSRVSMTGAIFSSLSREDEMAATKYRKMMKMGMPEGAVKHKMTVDGISVSIQDSVLREDIINVHSLERGTGNEGSPMRPPVNPMAAAIASSGGIGSLKKASALEKPSPVRPPSNPLAAAIASSGGMGSLKKTPVKEKSTAAAAMPSNPLAAAIAASGGRSGLKKTSPKDNNLQRPDAKPSSSNSLLGELSARGFRSTLKKTPKKSLASRTSTGKAFPSALRKTPQNSPDQSPDVSNSFSSSESESQKEPSESTNEDGNSSRHLSGIKVKAVRPYGEPPKRSTNTTVEDDYTPRQHLSGIKVKAVRPCGEPPKRSTNRNSEDDCTPRRHLSGIKVKSVRAVGEPPERSTTKKNEDDYTPRRHLSGIKVKSVRAVEEPPKTSTTMTDGDDSTPRQHLSGIKVKAVRSREVPSPKELPERRTKTTNAEDVSRRHHRPGIRIKAVRSQTVSPEELPKRSTHSRNEDDSARHNTVSHVRVKAVRSPENLPEKSTNATKKKRSPRHPSGISMKSERSPEEQPEGIPGIGLGITRVGTKQPRSSTNLYFKSGALLMESNLGKKGVESSRTQSEKTVDESERSGMRTERSGTRTKEPNSVGKVKNSDKRQNNDAITTSDGVDHHCQCIVM
jgi:hypothetical protein